MLSHSDLVDELRRLKETGKTTNADIARIIKQPSSRVADIFATDRKARKITMDEAKALVDQLKINDRSLLGAGEIQVDPETIAPILGALLPAVDPDRLSDPVLRALSGAFAYGLELLGDQSANRASPDAVAVAARGAVARFRELGST